MVSAAAGAIAAPMFNGSVEPRSITLPKVTAVILGPGRSQPRRAAPGTGYGPLLVRTALSSVFGGKTVLPFCCGIMADGSGENCTGKAPVQEHSTKTEAEGGGGASTVETKKGDA